MKAERFTDVLGFHAEGVVWWPEWGLRFVDGYSGEVVSVDSSGGESGRLALGSTYVGAVRPRVRGGMVAGIARGFALVDKTGKVDLLPEIWSDPGVRMNEGACDELGSFYCGSLSETEPREGRGSVYRLGNPADPPAVVLTGQGIPNGLVFDTDQAYYIDTLYRTVRCFDAPGDGVWSNPRTTIDLRDVAAAPDGMTMDEEGRLWIAMWGETGEVRCYRPGSKVPDEIVPVRDAHHVTSVVFGGADLKDLYVTTSQQGDGAGPAAGSLFRIRTGTRGRPLLPFRH